ncbi:MAG: lamin tail domain-containing protein [Verrucomicrobiota bacterium]
MTVSSLRSVVLAGAVLLGVTASAQVRITEFMANNTRTLADADGDYSDWIELHNPGTNIVNLENWFLTDAPGERTKWRFPNTNLVANGYLIVFASNKDRRIAGLALHTNFRLSTGGEYLALVRPDGLSVASEYGPPFPPQVADVSYGVPMQAKTADLIAPGANVKLLVPRDDTLGDSWTDSGFDDSTWISSQIASNIQTVMSNINATVYVRIPFVVADPAAIDFLTLRMKYEDGFVASLNGGEVARRNAPDSPAWNSSATAARLDSDKVEFEDFDLSGAVGLLHVGENVFAIQGLNSQVADPDFIILPELQATSLTFDTAAERYFAVPTPGSINGFGDTNLGPLILEVSHTPAIPSDGQDLIVTARLVRTFDAVGNVTLNYRVMFGPEIVVPMMDDGSHGDAAAGDGVYGGTIPANASTPGLMIRYYITATDASGDRSRWPLFPDARTTPQYLGTVVADSSVTNALPVIHWFVQTPARADNVSGTRCSVVFQGEFYDNLHVYVHGQSSLGFPKKSYNFDLNKGYHFRYATNEARVSDFNLLTTYPDKAHLRNILAYDTYRDAGAPYHIAFALRVQQNGKFYSDAHYVENGNDTYLQRIGLDPNGSLYKMYNTLDSATTGVEKKTRKSESNSDLQALINGLRRTGTARTQFIYDNVNVPAMVNYLAAMIVTGGVDCCHKNYYAYRDTEGTGEWQFLPWDQDLTFGRNWTGVLTYFDDTMYVNNPLFIGGNNALPGALFSLPAIRQMYLRRLRTLMDELLQPPATPGPELKYERAINKLATAIAPDATLDFAKWPTWGQKQTMPQAVNILTNQYLPARRNYLFKSQTVAQGGQIPSSQPVDSVITFGAIEFNPASGNQLQEYIELINTNGYAVDISGWRLAGGIAHTFSGGVVLPPGTKLYVSPNVAGFKTRNSGPRGGQGLLVTGNYRGQLSARGETISLFDSAGRTVSSSSYIGNPSPAQQYLRITEMMYHPPPPSPGSSFTAEDFEYIVLKNNGPLELDLTGVNFTNGIEFSFSGAAITNLGPGQRVLLVKNGAAYASRYGGGVPLVGSYQGNLDNSGENLRLEDAVGETILDFSYNNSWYPETDGAGSALITVDETAPWFAWESKTNWRPALPIYNLGIASWRAKYFSAIEITDPAIAGDNADPDGDGQANIQEYISGTDPRDARSYLRVGSAELTGENRGTIRLGFAAAAGNTYTLLYRDSLNEGVWLKLADFAAQSTSKLVEFSDSVVGNAKSRYYRLVTPKQE